MTNMYYNNGPLRRIGSLLMLGSIAAAILTMIHYNITTRTFIYTESDLKLIEKVPKPEEDQGFFWKDHSYGWGKFPVDCKDWSVFNKADVKRCLRPKEYVQHKYKLEYRFEYAFGDYLEETYKYKGEYRTIFCLLYLCFIIGLACFKGWVYKLINWIKNG